MPLSPQPEEPARRPFGTVRRWARFPLAFRVATLILAAALSVAGLLLARDLYESTVRDAQRNLLSLTTLLAQQADEALQAIELVQAAMVDDFTGPGIETEQDFIQRASTFSIHEQLQVRSAAVPQVGAVMIIGADGRLLASSRSWPIAHPEADGMQSVGADLASAPAKRIVVVRNRDTGLNVYVAHRIFGMNGRFLGLILGRIDLRYFESLYTRVSSDAADVISIVDGDGTMLARHPCPPGTIGRIVPRLKSVSSPGTGTDGARMDRLISPIDGQDRFIAAETLAHYPLIVGASRTAEAVLAGWRKQAVALGVATTLLVTGLLALLWAATRWFRAQHRLAGSEAARVAAEERARGERRLRNEYARFATALDSMRQGLALFDADGSLVVLSARFAEIYAIPDTLRGPGTSVERVCAHIRRVMDANEGATFTAELHTATTASLPSTLACSLADGRIIGMSVAPVAGGGFVCTCEDETERRRAEATIAHMAHHDALTGLPNRLLLGEATQHLLARPGRRGGALLLLDLDGFKQVNDVHGHPLGDALLQGVAARLQSVVDPGDLLARLGGDEFALVRRKDPGPDGGDSQPLDAITVAERIVEALAAPFVIGPLSLTIGTSIGIALADTPHCTPDLLLRNADSALYAAKGAGRGTWRLYEAAAGDGDAARAGGAPQRRAA